MVKKVVYYDRTVSPSFLDTKVILSKPPDYDVVNYFTISEWLEVAGKGDILVFAHDIIPYTVYEITPYSTDSKLLRFLQRGGIVVWLGDVPFFYRLHCYDSSQEKEIEETKELLKKNVSYTLMPEFYLKKYGPYKRDEQLCTLDIIGGFYADLNNVSWIGLDFKHLNFYKLNDVCYLNTPARITPTIIGKLLGYQSRETIRPVKLTTKIFPLTMTELDGICQGKYAGSWMAQIGEGVFVRLYDHREDIVNVSNIFKIAETLSNSIQLKL
ncbi:hypothetical protein [Sulfolobus sp. E11-6]|uniref:hypothetical protein n=1 Tax=Sulfolobus sp. E11-6 TaxID=2663020 RepID=UPI0012976A2C|nr:hypothetical protein [Sulfolobus sp. E11-6]QGA68538.1 hypothetical protein GFS33_07190 [Sulfolobus sp. E11-6]